MKPMGKVCCISGGTSGVGKAVAFGLAELGAEIVILGKNTVRGKAAVQAAVSRVIFTIELSKRLKGSGVTANAFHPGLVRSNLGRHLSFPLRTIAQAGMLAAPSRCKTGVYLAASDEVQNTSGRLFARSKPVNFNPVQFDGTVGAKLWNIAEQLTGLR